ncbi:flagellar hook-associated family protein [Roseibium aggregatum]|uniref:Flagellin n=1 Tax=Roseibium aggregatum TaxID=187304 RepID=A0A926NQV5_9HYPH|nr:flagellar hook-associated family protein [Roseibium aggregatum]MBD1545697.1 flagellar hook-associated family protein [Roseibium aggregatum]
MKMTYISTISMSDGARRQMMSQAGNVNKLQTELSSGRKFDVGLDLGSKTGETVTLRSEFEFLNTIADTNGLTASRLDVAQAAMEDMRGVAEDFLATLVAVRNSNGSNSVTQTEAAGNLELLMSRLNTQLNGNFIFAGINSDVAPINDYNDPLQPNKIAADAAFLGQFGFTQTDSNVSTITGAAMTAYLNGPFDALFADPNWGNDWSSASDQTVVSRISASEELTTSVSANEVPFRKLAQAFTMMSDLGNDNLGADAYKAVVDKSISLIGEAIVGVTNLMGEMGTAQERVSVANDRISIQTDILNQRINALENVNLEETSVHLNTAITQLETTYAISARIQQLSILNYF